MCPFFEVPCPLGKCKERMMRKEIPDHLSWKCKHRESSCEFCMTKMPLTDLQVSQVITADPNPRVLGTNCRGMGRSWRGMGTSCRGMGL